MTKAPTTASNPVSACKPPTITELPPITMATINAITIHFDRTIERAKSVIRINAAMMINASSGCTR